MEKDKKKRRRDAGSGRDDDATKKAKVKTEATVAGADDHEMMEWVEKGPADVPAVPPAGTSGTGRKTAADFM